MEFQLAGSGVSGLGEREGVMFLWRVSMWRNGWIEDGGRISLSAVVPMPT